MTITARRVRPLLGNCFIRLEGRYDEKIGLIVIPDAVRSKKIGFGQITEWNPTDKQFRACGGIPPPIGWYAICHDYAKAPIGEGVFRIPIDCVLGITQDKAEIKGTAAFQDTERCSFCGPAKSGVQNAMLLNEFGYCVRCGKNAKGEKMDLYDEQHLAPFAQAHREEMSRKK
jgi:hypothetical protein